MLRDPAFDQIWPDIENSLGLDRIPEPPRTLMLDTHKVKQDVVLGYWDQVLSTELAEPGFHRNRLVVNIFLFYRWSDGNHGLVGLGAAPCAV
jgi:hypothetical protein